MSSKTNKIQTTDERTAEDLKMVILYVTTSRELLWSILKDLDIDDRAKKHLQESINKLLSVKNLICQLANKNSLDTIKKSITENDDRMVLNNIVAAAFKMDSNMINLYEKMGDHILDGTLKLEASPDICKDPTFEELNDVMISLQNTIGYTNPKERLMKILEAGFEIKKIIKNE